MIQFYSPDILQTMSLPESDSAHCSRVLRMKAGDQLIVVDGHGHRYTCRLVAPHNKHAAVEIVACEDIKPVWGYDINIAVAPTKHNDRMEWLVEKLVEIGVNRITPLKCRYSERKEINTERLVKIAVSAMTQSLKATLPVIDEMTPIKDYLESVNTPGRFIGYCANEFELRTLAREYIPGTSATILIGPEGDFSPDEVKAAIDHGFVPVTMGDNRLRTETAALVGCDTCHIISQASEAGHI